MIKKFVRDSFIDFSSLVAITLTSLLIVPSQSIESQTWCSNKDVNCLNESKNKEWIGASGRYIPVSNPVRSGTDPDGSPIYVCRVSNAQILYQYKFIYPTIPGKLSPKNGICYVSFNGREIEFTEYEVFSGSARWAKADMYRHEACTGGSRPQRVRSNQSRTLSIDLPKCGTVNPNAPSLSDVAIIGGVNNNEYTYICTVGGASGKYQLSNNTCYVPYNGKEFEYSLFGNKTIYVLVN
jgi:hypothetical protein